MLSYPRLPVILTIVAYSLRSGPSEGSPYELTVAAPDFEFTKDVRSRLYHGVLPIYSGGHES